MQLFLEDFIDTLTGRSSERIYTILEEAKVGKEQLGVIAQRLVDFQKFAPLVLSEEPFGELILKSTISVNLRDFGVQIDELYRVDNQVSDLLNGVKAVFSSEISALENEVNALEKQVQNYAFLLSDGGAYDYAYMEPFNDTLNQDSFEWDIPDRASLAFGSAENASVRSDEGVLAISEQSTITSPITGTIMNGNASAMVQTDNGIENATIYTSDRGWRYVVASPNPVTSGLPEANGNTGAQVLLEFVLHNPGPCSEVRITPFSEHSIEVVRILTFEDMTGSGRDLLTTPETIDRPFTIHFSARTVARFQVLLNQPIYERRAEVTTAEIEYEQVSEEITPSSLLIDEQFEQTSQLYALIRRIILDKKGNGRFKRSHDVFHSVPKSFKRHWGDMEEPRVWAQDGMRTGTSDWNKRSYSLSLIHQVISQLSMDNITSLLNYPTTGTLTGPTNQLASILFGDSRLSISKIRASSLFNFEQFRNIYNALDEIPPASAPADAVMNAILFPPSPPTPTVSFNYTYFLGLEHISIGFGTPAQKSVFVTKPFNSIGDIGEMRLKVGDKNVVLADANRDSNLVTSIEYSVSNVTDPHQESDWIPLIPIDQTEVTGERFFPDSAGLGLFRFPALRSEDISLYRNGIEIPLEATTSYVYGANSLHVLGLKLPTGSTPDTDIFTVDYFPSSTFSVINFAERGFDSIPLVSSFSSDGAGEFFNGTGGDLVVTLEHHPYVDEDQVQANIESGLRIGPYFPITVIMSDGTVAENLTNYGPGNQVSFPTNAVIPTYIHRANMLIFNETQNQPFRVYYQYLKNNMRVRVVLRVNDKQFSTPKVDFIQVKAKTRRPNRTEAMQ